MEVESLLKETRKILKKCSRITQQIYSDSSPQLLITLHSEIAKGESLEHRLFQLSAKENVSLNQLRLLGHKVTFSQWRRANPLLHDPADLNTDANSDPNIPTHDSMPASPAQSHSTPHYQ